MVRLCIDLDEETNRRLEEQARRLGLKKRQYVLLLVKLALGGDESGVHMHDRLGTSGVQGRQG